MQKLDHVCSVGEKADVYTHNVVRVLLVKSFVIVRL